MDKQINVSTLVYSIYFYQTLIIIPVFLKNNPE